MKISQILSIAFRYDALLTRYALMITRSKQAANKITLQVFESYYNSEIDLDEKALRHYFKWAVKERSIQWKIDKLQWAEKIDENYS